MRWAVVTLVARLSLGLVTPVATLAAPPAAAVRVDQLGFATGETKIAYPLGTAVQPDAPFTAVDGSRAVVLISRAGAGHEPWNARYGAVQPLDLSALQVPGTYRIHVAGPPEATSPTFRIANSADLFPARVADVVSFFRAQRDGAEVIAGPLHRRPAHLRDRKLTYDAWPRYSTPRR